MKLLQKFFKSLGFITREELNSYLEQTNDLIQSYNIKANQILEETLRKLEKEQITREKAENKIRSVELVSIHQSLEDFLKENIDKVEKELKDQKKVLQDFGFRLESRNKEIDNLKKPYKVNGLTLRRGQNVNLTASNIPLAETDKRNLLSFYEQKTTQTVKEKTKNLKTIEDEVIVLKEGFENHKEKIERLEHPVIKRKISTPLTNELAKQVIKKRKNLPSGR